MRINFLFFIIISLFLFSCKGAKENSNENSSAPIDKREVIEEAEEEMTTDKDDDVIARDGTNYSAMSREICFCLDNLSDLMLKVSKAQEIGDTAGVQELQEQVLRETRKAEPCMNELNQKYPIINQMQNVSPKIMDVLEVECPKFAAVLKMRNGEK